MGTEHENTTAPPAVYLSSHVRVMLRLIPKPYARVQLETGGVTLNRLNPDRVMFVFI